MLTRHRRFFVTCSLCALALTNPATAQEAEADTTATEMHEEEDEEVIIVQGTRFRRRVQDEPIRVEVIAGEEVEEKAIMRPGNIAMLVNETGVFGCR